MTGQYMEEHCEMHPDYSVNKKALYLDYKVWCDGEGIRACTAKALTRRLAKRGIELGGDGHSRYVGLRLVARG